MSSTASTVPYDDLSESILDEVTKLNKSASTLTVGIMISLFVPAGFLFVFGFGIWRLIQASKLKESCPELDSPYSKFPGTKKSEVKKIALEHINLKRVLEFQDAHVAFWISAILPVVYIGGILGLIAFLMNS